MIDEASHTAEVAFVVLDGYQGKGIGAELLAYLTLLAKRQGLHGFAATVLQDNKPMLHLFESMGFEIEKRLDAGTYELVMSFKEK
jgi:GNAT superfamily N-acetyltransferase